MNIKKIVTVCIAGMAMGVVAEEATITDVKAQQRYPWNGKVDISYTVENAGTDERLLSVWAVDQTTGITNVAESVVGETAYTSGKHHIVWDMAADGLTLVSTNVVFAVTYKEQVKPGGLYCVIDLSGGTSASSYFVTYRDAVPSGGWSDEYKTTKLVLRKISAGTFTMGSPTGEVGRYDSETQHQVTLTKDYYVGVFPVTQRQWELVKGSRPSYFKNDAYYAPRPVERISYDMIRGSSAGAGWPNSSAVDPTSFLGILQAKSGLVLDLPTEAQWEYACRAGTTTALNSGKNLTSTGQDSEMDKVGRYWCNGGSSYSQRCDWSAGTAKVGSYAPNAWGLYDMHGNVCEWCLDWYGSYSGDVTDPKGSSSGSRRVLRGGGWLSNANICRSAYRGDGGPSFGGDRYGFRLVRTLSNTAVAETAARSEAVAATSGGASGESDPVRVDLTPGTRTAVETETITYSTEWVEGAGEGATAVMSVNGTTLSKQSGSGTVEWTPAKNGTYELTHKVLVGGEQVGETLTATFLVNHFPDIVFTANGYDGAYDGTGHGISVDVTDPAEGAVVTYSLTEKGEYTTSPILFTNVTDGAQSVYFKITANGYRTANGVETVRITPRAVTLTSGSAKKMYDGTPLKNPDIAISGLGWASGEGATYDVTGSQTEIGESMNTFNYTLLAGTKAANYVVTKVEGTLFVVPGLTITDVTAQQRYPWNGLVDVVVTLKGTAEDVFEVECIFAATNSATGAAIPVTSITQKGDDICSGTTWNRHFVWDAATDVGAVKFDDVALTVDASFGVQLWDNGPRWAKCNVGATKPEEYGYYFWWGDTVGYKRNAANNGWISVKDGTAFLFDADHCLTYGKDNSQLQAAGYIDSTGNLVAARDAATVHLGAPWRMPTKEEIGVLISKCDTTWTTRGGVNGRLVTGRGAYASKSIFLPAAGYGYDSRLRLTGSNGDCWSSTPDSGISVYAWILGFSSGTFYRYDLDRYCGQSVRPLRGFANGVISDSQHGTGVTTHIKLDCRTDTRTAAETETVTYSTDWVDDAGEGAIVEVSVGGVVICERSGSGTVEWVPSRGGTNLLTHIIRRDGTQVGETLSATFNVNGGPYTEIIDGVKWAYMAQDGWAKLGSGNSEGPTAVPKTTVGAIVTPSRIGGCVVRGIADYAFQGCDKLSAVTICEGIVRIGTAAFSGCGNLNAIDFEGAPPEGVADAGIKQDAAIRYNVAYEAQWLLVIQQCGWTNAKPYMFPDVVDVTAQQRYPWNGLVDIVVTIEGVTAEKMPLVECSFSATNSATGVALPVTSITQKGVDTGSGTTWKRCFIWDAAKDVGAVKIDDVALTVDASLGVQLWENGPYWAKCNVGATRPEEYGYYFWWGDTVGYKRDAAVGWISVKDGSSFKFIEENCPTYYKDISQLQSAGYIDSTGNLVAAHDAATAHLGVPWRMPTDAEFSALISNCDTTWTTRGGVNGRLVTGRGAYASKSIFLPAAGSGFRSGLYDPGSGGDYWSSTPNSYSLYQARFLCFRSDYFTRDYYDDRYNGNSVRPIRGFFNGAMSEGQMGVGVTTYLKLDCRAGVRTCSAEGKTIAYSTEWVDDAGEGAIAEVSLDGVVVCERSGSGTVEWVPSRGGTNLLTHIIRKDGAQVGETLSAIFNVNGGPFTEIVDDVEWTYMVYDGLAVVGSGDSSGPTAVSKHTRGAIAVPMRLGGCLVTGVGAYAFKDCTGLTQVVLSTNIVTIGANAFANDFYLDNVVIPDSVEEIGDGAFMNCTEMISLTLGSGLKKVGSSAFANCISLESVVFQEGLTNLGARAFFAAAGAMRLKSVSLPVSLEFIGDEAFVNSSYITGVTVPTHLKEMGTLFPSSYQKIESVVIPDGESMIMDAMFQGCSKLASVIIPVSVTAIGESAFANCEALVELGLPDEVTTLGARAFYQCLNLKTVSLPRKLTAINDETFGGCAQLDSLVIPAEVKTLGSRIYSGYSYTARLTGVYFLGNAPATQSNSYEGMPGALTSYVVKGSIGWYIPGSPTLPPNGWPTTGNARAITYWTPNEFEVTFDGNGGTPETYVSKQITDTTYSLPKSEPVRSGYLFRGWWTEKEAGAQIYWNTRVTATKAHTLYAHWKALSDTITVIFNPNGGTVEPAQKTYPPGVTFGELPVPTRIGHNFVGWYTAPVGGDLVDEATPVTKENNELYAHWVPITYRVAFDANGGSGSMYAQTHTYNVAKALTANAYHLTGFNFTGWSETRGGVVKYANRAVVENLAEIQGQVVTLYAVWNGASYSIRFDANGGDGIMENQTHQIGVSQALSKCTFTRKGYSFLGWATTPKGIVEYRDEEEVKNLTMQASATVPLYAVWSPISYTIAYDANGGTGTMSSTECLYDKEVTIPSCGFSKSGYNFTGWATSAGGGVVYTPGQKVLNLADKAGKVVTLFAVWELAGVEVPVFSPEGGTVFKGSCTVTLTCSTPGASIYYRIGATPKATSKYLYSKPFEITETSTVYSFAKLGDTESDCVTATYTKGKVITFEEAVKAKGITAFTHGGDAVWGVEEGLGEGNVCVRSGVIIDEQVSWFETTVEGPGTISFKWKASCEEDYPKHEWDHLEFRIDGKDNGRLDGVTDWVEVSKKLKTGTHTLTWLYVKDESDYEEEDCGWVDCVTWVADAPAPVPPGGEIVVPEGKTAKEFADEVNKNKAQYLNWPLEEPVSTDYLGYFTAVPKGDARVEFVLNEEGTNQVVEATTAAKSSTLESVLSKTGTLVIGDPLIGFYYSLKQGSDVTVGDKADLNKLAGRDELSFPLTTDKSKYFYQSLVTPTPVPEE